MNFDKIGTKSLEFLYQVTDEAGKFDELCRKHIDELEEKNVQVPDFEDSFEWINIEGKLSFKGNLLNKLCVLDFFTYCCINCMHVLPDLHELEDKYSIEDGVAVIGVHSAKFDNEKLLTNILNAVLRYDITHPCVNDANAVLWNKMSIQCWPTFVIVSPEGKVLLYLVGEGHKENLFKFVEVALKYYTEKGLIKNHALPIKLAKASLSKQTLSFPGKLSLSKDGSKIAIADTGHHQILITTDKLLLHRIGSGDAGWKDGSFTSCRFNAPQGLDWDGENIFVADTENHVIRKIDLNTKEVSTVTGTGKQGTDKEGGKMGVEQEISSPWDVLVSVAPGFDECDTGRSCLYIAQAGTHQIWCYFLQDGGWLKKGSQKKHTCLRFAGGGNEENRNNSYPHKASFAQPSGFTLATVKEQIHLYIADSESSSVRSIELKTGAVKAFVGGERDPSNLFGFGDVDGKGVDAKLQHPLSVAFNKKDGFVYVADSYNHKIKVIDPVTKICTTLCGKGFAGYKDGSFDECEFNEPGDIKVSPDGLFSYVADTNNHKIRLIDLQKKVVTTLVVTISDEVDAMESLHLAETRTLVNRTKAQLFVKDELQANLSKQSEIRLKLNFSNGAHLNKDADSKCLLKLLKDSTQEVLSTSQQKVKDGTEVVFLLPGVNENVVAEVELLLYLCADDEMCYMKQHIVRQSINHNETATVENILELTHIVSL